MTTPQQAQEQAVALADKHGAASYKSFEACPEGLKNRMWSTAEQLTAMLADHEQQVIAGLVARAEATSVQIEAWVDAAVQDGCTTRGMLGSYVATLAYQAGFAAAQIKSRPTEGDQHEQQIRPQMDAVGGRQPLEGASTVFTGGGADLVSSITALLELDAAGALVPHGVGGHARNLLTAAAEAIAALQAKLEALQAENKGLRQHLSMAEQSSNQALARLAARENQEPVATAVSDVTNTGYLKIRVHGDVIKFGDKLYAAGASPQPVAWPIDGDKAKRIAEKHFVTYEVAQDIARDILAGASPARKNQYMTPGCGAGGLGAKEGASPVEPASEHLGGIMHVREYVCQCGKAITFPVAQPAQMPGYVLVPVEPTEAMIAASVANYKNPGKWRTDRARLYKAMIAAAPDTSQKERSNG